MSSDVLAPASTTVFSPHALAAALNRDGPVAPQATPSAPAAERAAVELPEPGEESDADAARTGLLMFRVGAELFAAPLADVEEAIELAEVTPLPEMPPHMLGVVRLRGVTLRLYTPAAPLGVEARAPQAAIVVRDGEARIALAIDDVEDVIELRNEELRATPDASDDRVLLAVACHGRELVSTVDVAALVAACVGNSREAA